MGMPFKIITGVFLKYYVRHSGSTMQGISIPVLYNK